MKFVLWTLVGLVLLAGPLGPAAPARARDEVVVVGRFQEGERPQGWKLENKTGEPVYKLVRDKEFWALHLKAEKVSFGFTKEVKLDLKEYPFLNWRWKAVTLPAGGDFRQGKTDDQAAQVYVSFPTGLTRLSTLSVGYYWDNLPPKGTLGTSPAWAKLKVLVLRNREDKLGEWQKEKRNVYEDFKRLFGQEPPLVGGVSLYINSQHTESTAESYFADIYFSKE